MIHEEIIKSHARFNYMSTMWFLSRYQNKKHLLANFFDL
jgi:hypothetical protein